MKVIVTVPTYNERENIGGLIRAILDLGPQFEVIVADDDSPDGTWQVVEELQRKETRVHLLHRKQDKGRGHAGAEAFQRAIALDANRIVEMDADFSHDPQEIPKLLAALDANDIALGSRLVPGGEDIGRPLSRRLVTRAANAYTRVLLGLNVRDCNSGFRAYRRNALSEILEIGLHAEGPDIVQEVMARARTLGLSVGEVPIRFAERRHGSSKLTIRRLLRGLATVLKLRKELRTTRPR